MGNNQSNITDTNIKNDTKADIKPDIKTKSILKKTNISDNKIKHEENTYFDEPKDYHKTNKLELDNRISEYQYFQQDPIVNYDFTNNIRQESNKDPRFQDDINSRYQDELNNRDISNNEVPSSTKIYQDKVRQQISGNMRTINNSQNKSTIDYDAYGQPLSNNRVNSNKINMQPQVQYQQTQLQQEQPEVQYQQNQMQYAQPQIQYTQPQVPYQQGEISISREKALEIKNIKLS